MTIADMIRRVIDQTPSADGLVNIYGPCGCHRDDLAPCNAPDLENCELAKAEILKEPRGECGVGDYWFTAIGSSDD